MPRLDIEVMPMKRLGQPDEIAVAIEFLSDDAAFITAQILFGDDNPSIGKALF
jgi:NAD(P)-dependent dehydrogenase (short-subunit alcohol dehydrogenase family)